MPRSNRRILLALLCLVLLPAVVVACMCDYDTLKQERARFADTLEIAPNFARFAIQTRCPLTSPDGSAEITA
jgi:hypothetical protein